jgi:type I restriction enzyme S subunit
MSAGAMSVPKLRFKEFGGDWEEKRLGDVANFQSGYAFSSDQFGEVGTKLVTPKNFTKFGLGLFDDSNTKFTTEVVDAKFLCKAGDLLVLLTDLTPSCELLGKPLELTEADGEVLLNQRIVRIEPNKSSLLISFLKTFLLTDDFHIRMATTASGTTVRHSSNKVLSETALSLPTLPEQKKIAAFLGVVDAKIAALRARVLGLQTYKRGLMQALFSQTLRFTKPDGTAFPDWEEKRLGEILSERREMETKGEGLPHISLTTEGVVPKSARYDRDFLVGDDEVKKYKVTRFGDLCYNPANLKFGVISMNHLSDGIFSPIYVTFEIGAVDRRFLEFYVKQWSFQKKVRRFEQGTVYERQAVSAEDFVKALIPFPHPDEQAKIAEALSVMDAKIAAVQGQVDRMQDFKKGLLQQMFV